MFLPINGRIAIIDNEIKEVEPLFEVFSRNRIPYVFIKGDEKDYLPDESDETNDIRIVFLDLNLVGSRTPTEKEIKSTLYSVLKRVISKNNFPYSIILWSKQDNQYKNLVEDLFTNDLPDRKPISIDEFIKSDFFSLDEVRLDSHKDIIEEVNKVLMLHQSYNTLIYWENKVHKSADYTLQSVFSSYESDQWVNQSNFIIEKLSQAYLGFSNHKTSNYIARTKGSLQAFNSIFFDTLESQINILSNITDRPKLTYEEITLPKEKLLDSLNFKLIASKTELELDYPGVVISDTNDKSDAIFKNIFNESVDRFSFQEDINNFSTLDEKAAGKALEKKYSAMRKECRGSWKKVYIVVTPLCDKVQNKQRKIRVVKGFVIEKKYRKYLDQKSEALYISPSFFIEEDEKSFILVLNFRYFFTIPTDKKIRDNIKNVVPVFRLRNTVIAEIQSKLARHINRQGILYTE